MFFSPATWSRYREELLPYWRRIAAVNDFYGADPAGPRSFDEFPPTYRPGEVFTDHWGCVWENITPGMQGIISHHPLGDWAAWSSYQAPDPLQWAEYVPRDWAGLQRNIQENQQRKYLSGPGERFWERVHFVRGYQATMLDLADDSSRITRLIDLVLEYNFKLIDHALTYDVDGLGFGDDWGEQNRLMVSPEMWRRYFKPGYREMFQRVRRAGKQVFFHTDGHLLPVIPDLIECGVTILNVQFGGNGIDRVAELCRGRVCVAIDLDRQWVMPYGTPEDVKAHVRQVVAKLDNGHGGVILWGDVYPDTPLANIRAFCEVFEELRAGA
jgi:hypothetical protein